jgi:hypothetical protein
MSLNEPEQTFPLAITLSTLSLSLPLCGSVSPILSVTLSSLLSLALCLSLCLSLSVCLLSACVDDDDEDFVETRAYATSANIAKAMTRGEIILDGLCSYQSGTGSGISVSWRDYGPC